MKVLDLFSGIGGISYGLELTGGFRTVAFCEIEKYPQLVLKKHWPDIPIYSDVKTLSKARLQADGISVDVICGGFPCQDLSVAGRGGGLEKARSGLWWEFHRLIKEIRPHWVIIENVSALRSRGLDQVLRSLAEIRYDAEWHCIPASAVGAPHRRDRIFIVAYSTCKGLEGWQKKRKPYFIWQRLQQQLERCSDSYRKLWAFEPNVGRVANGIPKRVDRLKCLGNAVVPQIPMLIGLAIMDLYGEVFEQQK